MIGLTLITVLSSSYVIHFLIHHRQNVTEPLWTFPGRCRTRTEAGRFQKGSFYNSVPQLYVLQQLIKERFICMLIRGTTLTGWDWISYVECRVCAAAYKCMALSALAVEVFFVYMFAVVFFNHRLFC